MIVIDLNGNSLQVTDLEKAIKQAKRFMGYRHSDESFIDFDKERNAYWTDLYEKLILLKNKTDEQSGRQNRI